MADETNTTANQQGAGTQTADEQPAASSGTQTEEQPAGDKTFTQAELNRILAKEKSAWERKQKLSEDERKSAEIDELKAQLRERDARDSVQAAASTAGVRNPRLFFKVVKDDLEFDKDGNITNLKTVIDEAKKDAPELFGVEHKAKGSADGGAGKESAAASGHVNSFIRRLAGRSS